MGAATLGAASLGVATLGAATLGAAVSVRTVALHGPEAAHAAIGLVATTFEQFGFAGGFVGAGKEAAEHHRVSTGRDGLHDVAREPSATIGDEGNAKASGRHR